MAGSNTVWRIEWGNYHFALDRKTLTYDLTETQTGTVWASSLSVGWIELEDRATGERVRHDFATAKLVSIVEKSSSQGKRLLIGLDVLGVPVDLYFICSQREIQLTVEASRDTRQFLVQEIGLLPGLVSVPDDGASYLVLPVRDGIILPANAFSEPEVYPLWCDTASAIMPFIGAVQANGLAQCSLTLITDSIYGQFIFQPHDDKSASIDVQYGRDPERRRLDVRVRVDAGGDYITVARHYRERVIDEKRHVTLRRKLRDRPILNSFIGVPFFFEKLYTVDGKDRTDIVKTNIAHGAVGSGARQSEDVSAVVIQDTAHLETARLTKESHWELLESDINKLSELQKEGEVVWYDAIADWAADHTDIWTAWPDDYKNTHSVPLRQVVYHDSLIMPTFVLLEPRYYRSGSLRILRLLLNCAPPMILPSEFKHVAGAEQIFAIACPLHRLTFSAFVTAHTFMRSDFTVEQVTYSDKTSITTNQNKTESFERDDLHLPPLGFYVRHIHMEAHDALRVGEQTFATRAWRIRRSLDGKPLETSEDVLVQEFPV